MPLFGKIYKVLTECTGIELHIQPDNSISGRICEASINKNLLKIGDRKQVKGDLNAILKNVPQKLIAITLTGKGVLIKKTSRSETISSQNLDQLFPNLKADQFYLQNFISGDQSYVAIIRKEIVANILLECKKAQFKVLSISLGPFSVSHILDQLNTYNQKLQFDGHSIEYSKELVWENYHYRSGLKSDFPLKIDIEPIAEEYILSYATAFQLLMYDDLDAVQLDTNETTFTLDEFREEKKFKTRSVLIVSVVFAALLVNFLVFGFYDKQNQKLSQLVGQSSANMDNLQKLENEIEQKQKLIKDLGWNKGIGYAFICDQIGLTTPSNVKLTELIINPSKIINIPNGEKSEEYEIGKIKIKGQTQNVRPINEWIYALEEKDWVKKVMLEDYIPDDEKNNQQFTITITY